MKSYKLLIVTTVALSLRAFLLPYANHFRELGWRVDGMALDAAECPVCKEHFDGLFSVNWSRNPLAPSNFLNAVRQVRQIVATEKYDLVHVHTPVAAFVTRLALRRQFCQGRVKIVYTAHGFHFHQGGSWLKNTLYLFLEKIAGRWTDALIVINQADEAVALQKQIVPAERLHYFPGIGVDHEHYAPETVSSECLSDTRKKLGLGPQDFLITMIAEFNPGKRHVDLLQAFAKMKRSDVHLALAGTGPELCNVRKLAERLGVSERCHFLGFVADIRPLILASCTTVLPSEREGLPRSVLESLSLGVPAIGTRIRGIEDLIDGSCGLLVALDDVDALCTALKMACEPGNDFMSKGSCGRAKIIRDFSLSKVIKLQEKLYETLLSDEGAL